MKRYVPLVAVIIAITLLGGCRRNRISVSSEASDSTDRLESMAMGQDVIIEAIEEATLYIEEHPFNNTEQARVEGYQYLWSVVRAGIDSKLLSDPLFPTFRNVPNETTRMGLDNPDNLYMIADVLPGNSYRIWGNRGSSRDFVLQLYDADNARGGWAMDPDTIQFSPEGDFILWLNPEGRSNHNGAAWENNSMKLMEEADSLLVRFTNSDWDNEEPGEIHIQRIGSAGITEKIPDAVETRKRMDNLGKFIIFNTSYWVDFLGKLIKVVPANVILPPRKTPVEGLPTQYSSIAHYAISDDEALLVTTWPTTARYQGFQLANLWNQSLEYGNRITSLTGDQARLSSDGTYYFVIAKTDPEAPNWLDTTGWNQGFIMLRYQGLKGDFPRNARPKAKVVKISELYNYLPADEPHYGPEERQAQIAARQEHLKRRYSY